MDLVEYVSENFDVSVLMKEFPADRELTIWRINLEQRGLLIDKKQKHKRRVLTEEKLHYMGARLEHTPRKSLKRLAQETLVSKSSGRTATQLLNLRPYRTTVP
jgi:hypothetical protein